MTDPPKISYTLPFVRTRSERFSNPIERLRDFVQQMCSQLRLIDVCPRLPWKALTASHMVGEFSFTGVVHPKMKQGNLGKINEEIEIPIFPQTEREGLVHMGGCPPFAKMFAKEKDPDTLTPIHFSVPGDTKEVHPGAHHVVLGGGM